MITLNKGSLFYKCNFSVQSESQAHYKWFFELPLFKQLISISAIYL